ncbi:ankyrin repeat-containing protein [Anaeramoeba flamelloides]|uniref:Ankyrin repeat-containing protein n=1 Tax=Anaeramoeba flamelloides TaxID=1746091 RepID=A0ABQ8YTL9_9EUKA|nr:ankyrin repeat-containing protein [Anaeramoeba flamelloides]
MFKKKIFKINLPKDNYKILTSNADSTTDSIIKTVVKRASIENCEEYGILLKTASFERFLEDEEKPFVLAETLHAKEQSNQKASLHFKKKTNLVVLNIQTLDQDESFSVTIENETTISQILSKVATKAGAVDISQTVLQQKKEGEKPINLTTKQTIQKVLQSWTEQNEKYSLIFLNLGLMTIKGMEDFFTKYENLVIKKEPFNEFNRRIMDIVVEGNTSYLKNEGFSPDTQGNTEAINDNMGILTRLKDDMENKKSKFNSYLKRTENMVNELIEQYLKTAIPAVVKLMGIKGVSQDKYSIKLLSDSFEKNVTKLNQEKQIEISRAIKDLKSLDSIKESKIQGGIGDLIKQDLGVYFFNTKNELEIMSIDPLTSSSSKGGMCLLTKPIKQGLLDVKTSYLGRKSVSFFVLTPRFLYVFSNFKSKETIPEIIQTSKSIQSLALSILKIERTVIEHSENEINKTNENLEEIKLKLSNTFTFDLIHDEKTFRIITQNEQEMEEWIRLINLMQSRIISSKPIGIHKVNQNIKYSYEIKYLGEVIEDKGSVSNEIQNEKAKHKKKKSNKKDQGKFEEDNQKKDYRQKYYLFEVSAFNEKWKIKKNLIEFNLWIKSLKFSTENLILPIFPKSFKLQKFINEKTISDKSTVDNEKKKRLSKKVSKFNIKKINRSKKDKKQINKKIKLTSAALRLGNQFIEACLNELLINYNINQNLITLEFFQINNIFRAITNNNIEQVIYLATVAPSCLDIIHNGQKAIHYASKKSIEMVTALVEQGCDYNLLDNEGKCILTYSIIDSKLKLFTYLLDLESIQLDIPDKKGVTPFLYSISKRNHIFTTMLADKGVNINHQDNQTKYSAAHIALNNGDIPLLELLIERKISLDLTDSYGRTILHMAVMKNEIKIVTKLLNSAVNPNIQDKFLNTSLHKAVTSGSLELTNLLLNNNADPNIANIEKQTPLHLAITNKTSELVKLLLKFHADPNKKTEKGFTCLHLAVLSDNLEIIKLLKSNCNQLIVNDLAKSGFCPLHDVILQKDLEILDYFIKELKCDINITTIEGQTVMHIACKSALLQIIENLIENGCDLNVQDTTIKGSYALHIAVENGDLGCIRLLLIKGANINSIRKDGKSPLLLAAKLGFDNVINILAEHGADINSQDKEGNTALHIALKNGNERTATVLAQNGALLNMINNKGQSALQTARSTKVKKMLKEASDRFQTLGGKKSSPQNIQSYHNQPTSFINDQDKFLNASPFNSSKFISQWSQKLLDKLQTIEKKNSNNSVAGWLKVTYHKNSNLSVKNSAISIRFDLNEQYPQSTLGVFEATQEKIGFKGDYVNFKVLYEDKNCDFIIMDDDTSMEEIEQFGQIIHIFSKKDYQKLFNL